MTEVPPPRGTCIVCAHVWVSLARCAYVYVHMPRSVHVSLSVCTCVYARLCLCVPVSVCECACGYTCVLVCLWCLAVHAQMCARMPVCGVCVYFENLTV